jgi:hypothetical protein
MDRKDIPHDLDMRVNYKYHAGGNYDAVKIERPHHREIYKLNIKAHGRSRIVYADAHGREVNYREHY